MPCTGRFATAAEYDAFMCTDLDLTDATVLATIELALDIAASDIHAAMAAVDACSCTLAAWTTTYLKKLNIIDAMVMHACPCGRNVTEELRMRMLDWVGTQLENIRSGLVPLCEGDTAKDYPAWGSVEQGLTAWSRAEIMANAAARVP